MAATTTSAATTISATTTTSSADAKPAEAGPTCKVPARCLFAQLTSPRVGVSSFTSASAVRAQIVVQRVTSARLLLDNVSECKELLSALPLR
jgi:hypothetical protein